MNTIAWITSKNEQYDIKDIEARKTKLNIEDLPKNLSAFSNDMGFIDKTVNNLINYYKKSETYTKTEIDQKLSAKWDSKFVDKLPTEDISTTTIYFLKRKKEQGTTQYENDVYDEYIYTGTWELIGNTYVDLTDYYRKSEVEEVIDSKVLVETNNRILSENEIKNNIENVNNYAKSIENNLNSEISTRQNNDLLHDTKINEVESNLNSEISRAKSAENTLSNRCDTYDSHIANTNNPHNVTKSQIGLGNVTNVPTTDTITLNSENNITSGAVYTALENKVDKIDGRGLSEQNFTYAEKTKLSGLRNYDDTSISNRVTATENAITTLNGNSSVSGSVDKKIADAIAGVAQLDFKIVSSLPSTGIKGTIYLIRGTGTETTQQYDEYIWVNDKWEKLGKSTIEVNLSDIYSKSEVNALVSVKNDKITITDDNSTALTDADTFSTTSNSGTNPTNLTKRPLSLLWNYVKSKISSVLGLTKDNYGGKASTAGTADSAKMLKPFASWDNPYLYDETNGTRFFVFKIRMVNWFNSILIQIYGDINYALSRKYILGLWHNAGRWGYNVSVTDLGGTISNALRVWLGNDGNVYLQAKCEWTSKISFRYLENITDITIEKIGASRLGSNKDLDGNVLFTPLTDPIIDCGSIRGASDLSSASKKIQYLKADVFTGKFQGDVTGNLTGTADKATSVVDYGDTSKTIQIGYAGAGATVDNLAYIAGYLTGGTQIKDVDKNVLQVWLGIGSLSSLTTTDKSNLVSAINEVNSALSNSVNDITFEIV